MKRFPFLNYFFTTVLLCGSLMATPLMAYHVHIYRSAIKMHPRPRLGSITSKTHYADLDLTELRLSNGMRVVLKPTRFAENEVFVQLFALGGFAVLDEQDRASGKLSPQLIWSSGFGDLDGPVISQLLRSHAIDFKIKTRAHYRHIDVATNEEGLKKAFKVIHLIFTSYQYKKEALSSLSANIKESLQRRYHDRETAFEDTVRAVNTDQHSLVAPLSLEKVEAVDPDLSHRFFQRTFTRPEDFTMVVVGDFSIPMMEEMLERYIANIPAKDEGLAEMKPATFAFPSEPVYREVKGKEERGDLTAITYPLHFQANQENFYLLDGLAQSIETRLRNTLREKYRSTLGVDVSYEFPSYPQTETIWLTVEFRDKGADYRQTVEFVRGELRKLVDEGISDDELDRVKDVIAKATDFWKHHNAYWLAVLSNYYKFGWEPSALTETEGKVDALTVDRIHEELKKALPLDHFTVVHLSP